jgi:hypothetical protein
MIVQISMMVKVPIKLLLPGNFGQAHQITEFLSSTLNKILRKGNTSTGNGTLLGCTYTLVTNVYNIGQIFLS